jgi:hypothetical protein
VLIFHCCWLMASSATAFCSNALCWASSAGCFPKLRNGLLSLPGQLQGNKHEDER